MKVKEVINYESERNKFLSLNLIKMIKIKTWLK